MIIFTIILMVCTYRCCGKRTDEEIKYLEVRGVWRCRWWRWWCVCARGAWRVARGAWRVVLHVRVSTAFQKSFKYTPLLLSLPPLRPDRLPGNEGQEAEGERVR